jgi:hypothetical protein
MTKYVIRGGVHYGTVDEMTDRIKALEAQLATYETAAICEIAARNPSVMDYMHHWERRAKTAETALTTAHADGYAQGVRDGLRKMPPDCAPKGVPVLIAGGIAMRKTGDEWYSGMCEPAFSRRITWTVNWWAPIPQQNDPLPDRTPAPWEVAVDEMLPKNSTLEATPAPASDVGRLPPEFEAAIFDDVEGIYEGETPEAELAAAHTIYRPGPRQATAEYPATAPEAVARAALEWAAERADYYAEADYAAMHYAECCGMTASGTAHQIRSELRVLRGNPAAIAQIIAQAAERKDRPHD